MKKINFINNPLYPETDIGISKLFMDSFNDELIFCKDLAEWYVWNGKYWEKDAKEGGKRCELMKDMATYCIAEIYASDLKKEQKEYLLKVYSKLNAKYYRDSILKDAQSIRPIDSSIFDTHKLLFNCQNGTYDFERDIFRDFERTDYITDISNVTYDKTADCPRFKQYLKEVLEDQDKIDYLLKMASYALTGDTSRECFFILYGNKTRNGKSTFASTLYYLAGSYSKILREESITQKSFNNGGGVASPDIARLKKARIALVNEISPGMLLNISLIKAMTGNDGITARFLQKEDFDFTPQCKLFINTNDFPRMSDDSIFNSRRLELLCFEKVIDAEHQDINLKEHLKQEINGIFNYIAPYYKRLKEEGFCQPESTKKLIEKYKYNSNNILLFEKECLFKDAEAYMKVSDIYSTYTKWCEENGYNALAKKNFKDKMEAIGAVFTEKKSKKNDKGFFENTYWVTGFSTTKPAPLQMLLEPITDEEMPF